MANLLSGDFHTFSQREKCSREAAETQRGLCKLGHITHNTLRKHYRWKFIQKKSEAGWFGGLHSEPLWPPCTISEGGAQKEIHSCNRTRQKKKGSKEMKKNWSGTEVEDSYQALGEGEGGVGVGAIELLLPPPLCERRACRTGT